MRPLVVLLAACLCTAAEPAPAWISDAGREAAFPASTWLVGSAEEVVSEVHDRARCLELATDASQGRLARAIRACAAAESTAITGGSAARFDRFYAGTSRLVGALIQSERTLASWFDEDGQRVHAIGAVPRASLATALRGAADAELSELDAVPETPGGWSRTLAGLHEVEDDLVLARGIAPDPADQALAQRLSAAHDRAAAALLQAAGRPVNTLADLAQVLAAQLGPAGGAPAPLVVVPAFTVGGSELTSAFGRRLADELATALSTTAHWKVSKASAAGPTRDAVIAAGASAVVLGTTWEQADGVRCVVAVHRLVDGQWIAAAEATIAKAGLATTGLAIAPANAGTALTDEQRFHRAEATGNGMKLELWTSRGDDAPVFLAGETMQVFLRLDRPGHLRLIHHLADGRRVLLIDDLAISDQGAHQPPDGIPVGSPYGAETLLAYASADPLPTLATRNDGDRRILVEVPATAGDAAPAPDPQVRLTTTRVVVTTLER